ncbi:MAG: hypothetical protein AAFP20_10860 [Cyanobacteria bacterium J06614_10]
MSYCKTLSSLIGVSLMAAAIQAPAHAQMNTAEAGSGAATTHLDTVDFSAGELETTDYEGLDLTFEEEATLIEVPDAAQPSSYEATSYTETVPVAEATSENFSQPATTTAADLTFPSTDDESVELAQRRRRTRGRAGSSNFVGIGADFGFADDVSFAVISRIGITRQLAVRPSVLIGDDFAVLVPVTYEFDGLSADASGGFRIVPYAGVGASFSDGDDDSDINLLLSAGADVPISSRFTLNAQANLGVFDDSDFGVTVGVGYNLGNILGR